MIKLWLDDVRPPAENGHVGWTWAKTYDEAVGLLKTGTVIEASLDHDLTVPQTLGYQDQERTGYDVLCWMEENNVWPVGGVRVHSMNPAGRFRMEQVIEAKMRGGRE